MLIRRIEQIFPIGFDLQVFAEGEGEGGGGGGTSDVFNYSGEFETIVDPLTSTDVKVPKELVGLLGHIRTTERNATKKKTDEELKTLLSELEASKGDNAAIAAKLQEIEDLNLTAEQRATKKFQATIKGLEEANEAEKAKTDAYRKKFEDKLILTDVFASFDTITQPLCNAQNTADLFIREGQAKAVEVLNEDGEGSGVYETRLSLTIKEKDESKQYEGTASELFEKWVKQSHNIYQIQSTAIPGADTRITRGQIGKVNPEFENLSPVERLKIVRRGQA